jgi:hypothetical protein
MTDAITKDVLAYYATPGNAHRIIVTRDANGTFSYGEFHRLKHTGGGAGYATAADVFAIVHRLIGYAADCDGITFKRIG